jgi:murein L,D-transpeptidase YafK
MGNDFVTEARRPGGVPRLKPATVRSLLTFAAIAAAIAVGGCNPSDIPTSGRAQAPLSDRMVADIAAKNMDKESPILVRLFKEESELEVWKKNKDGEFALLKTYPICRWSGDLGPKKKEGDRQAPEGFYTITPANMNPNSNYYLAFNTGFPNAYDRAWNYTGSDLMVHGDCSSRGCYAMTDEQIQEIYALGRESFFGGQSAFQLQAFPFRMTALNMAKHRNNPNFAFWKMIKEGYDHFEASHQEPKVAVCEKRYVFDAAAPADSSKPLNFSPAGKCPAYQLDPAIADAVLDKRRTEQFQMAEYIGRNVAVVPPRHGIDGGMNQVFAAKLAGHGEYDNNGRTLIVAGNSQAPGYLPRASNGPAGAPQITVPPQPSSEPVEVTEQPVLASVRLPQPAPRAKEGEAPAAAPTSIAGLLGIFGGSKNDPQPEAPAPAAAVTSQSAKTQVAKAKQTSPVFRTASAQPAPVKPQEAAPKAELKTVAETPPPLRLKRADKNDAPRGAEPQLRTAYTAPPAGNNGMLTGAQPVVPTGSFDSRWSGFR